jgi:predicted ABC-class ATPase
LVNGNSETTATLTGLLVPRGITLIVAVDTTESHYSRCIAAGIYNVPGDGREFCATVDDAAIVRMEDINL